MEYDISKNYHVGSGSYYSRTLNYTDVNFVIPDKNNEQFNEC